jgi:penicillin amidase
MSGITPQDMMNLQNDNYNTLASTALPLFLKHLRVNDLNTAERRYADSIGKWDYMSDVSKVAPTVFKLWYDSLEKFVWHDELRPLQEMGFNAHEHTLIEALLRDSTFSYIDDINTNGKEKLSDALTASFRQAIAAVQQLAAKKYETWGAYKNTTLYHLLGQQLLPFARAGLAVGGGVHVVNATQHNHGPSWKMVVELTEPKQAWVIYPGGQSGNAGSKYYDNFVDDYAAGKYYQAWIMNDKEKDNPRILARLSFKKK